MSKSGITKIAVAAALMLVLALALSFFISTVSGTDEIEIVLPSLPPDSPGGGTPLSPIPPELSTDYLPVTIDVSNVQQVVATLERPVEYYCEYEITLRSGESEGTSRRRMWVKNGYSRVEITRGSIVENAILGGSSYIKWRSDSTGYYKGPAGDVTSDNLPRVPTYEDVIDISRDLILDAGYAEDAGRQYIYLTIQSDAESAQDKYQISIDSGLLSHFSRVKDGVSVYSMAMDVYNPDPQPDSAFTLPDGRLAWGVQ